MKAESLLNNAPYILGFPSPACPALTSILHCLLLTEALVRWRAGGSAARDPLGLVPGSSPGHTHTYTVLMGPVPWAFNALELVGLELGEEEGRKGRIKQKPSHLSISSHARNIVQHGTKAALKIAAARAGLPTTA